MLRRIAHELKEHIPFTALGALTGIMMMTIIALGNVPVHVSYTAFYVSHPVHVLLSALVTTAMYMRYRKARFLAAVIIGWTGSAGIATISDALIPYLGGTLLHAQMEFHVPFTEPEHWWVNLVALAGIAIGLPCYWAGLRLLGVFTPEEREALARVVPVERFTNRLLAFWRQYGVHRG